jgi:hypothetical protein
MNARTPNRKCAKLSLAQSTALLVTGLRGPPALLVATVASRPANVLWRSLLHMEAKFALCFQRRANAPKNSVPLTAKNLAGRSGVIAPRLVPWGTTRAPAALPNLPRPAASRADTCWSTRTATWANALFTASNLAGPTGPPVPKHAGVVYEIVLAASLQQRCTVATPVTPCTKRVPAAPCPALSTVR